MFTSSHFLTLVLIWATSVSSNFLGRRFPAPVHLTRDGSLVSAAWRNVTAVFDSYFDGDVKSTPKALTGLENITFSVGMFSMHDPAAQALQYHYTSEAVKENPGVDTVDGNSIYGIASLSKLFTVFAGLLEFTDDQWSQPITNFITNLSRSALDGLGDDAIHHTQWEQVTLRALAAQIAGVPRDAEPFSPGEMLIGALTGGSSPTKYGLPPLDLQNPAVIIPCALDTELFAKDPSAACPPHAYLENMAAYHPPSFQPWTTPAYADTGFMLLGMALANITGKPIAQVYPDAIFGPLHMTNSKSASPQESEYNQYVIPGNASVEFAPTTGYISSGGLFSSLNDLAKFGTALLNSTLLPADKTREWMKPVSHSSSLSFSVGAPWEIYRYTHPSTGVITDIYTKSGDSGDFSSFGVLIPDYDAGFNVLTASTDLTRATVAQTIADIITNTMIPALETQAAAEAAHDFAGTYKSDTAHLNSSLTLILNDSSTDPGLYISSFISNGTDLTPFFSTLFQGPSVKLQPSIEKPGQIAFRAVPGKVELPHGIIIGHFLEMFNLNFDWIYADSRTYGNLAVALFVFDLSADRNATAVSPAAFRVTLKRIG
jgi:CubicO group peptidase (beta-lactamase class C family)